MLRRWRAHNMYMYKFVLNCVTLTAPPNSAWMFSKKRLAPLLPSASTFLFVHGIPFPATSTWEERSYDKYLKLEYWIAFKEKQNHKLKVGRNGPLVTMRLKQCWRIVLPARLMPPSIDLLEPSAGTEATTHNFLPQWKKWNESFSIKHSLIPVINHKALSHCRMPHNNSPNFEGCLFLSHGSTWGRVFTRLASWPAPNPCCFGKADLVRKVPWRIGGWNVTNN